MRYLVTGAAGFLGTNLCLRLLSEGHEVLGLDNLSTGSSANLLALNARGNFTFMRHDVVRPLPAGAKKAEFIYNLACPASPPRYQKDPLQTFRTSVWGAWNLIEHAKECGVPILHASTSEVYGDPLSHPQREDYWGNVNPTGVRACYDEGKRGAETMLFDYRRKTGSAIKVVRIFNTYGPFMDPADGRVVSNFIGQALRGEPLTIYGNGTQTRSFCYVDDLIEGMVRMEKTDAGFAGPVNLGNPEEFTLLALAAELEAVLGRKLEKRFLPLPKDDPAKRRPDISLAKRELGWEPSTPLRSGLAKTAEYFRSIDKKA